MWCRSIRGPAEDLQVLPHKLKCANLSTAELNRYNRLALLLNDCVIAREKKKNNCLVGCIVFEQCKCTPGSKLS